MFVDDQLVSKSIFDSYGGNLDWMGRGRFVDRNVSSLNDWESRLGEDIGEGWNQSPGIKRGRRS